MKTSPAILAFIVLGGAFLLMQKSPPTGPRVPPPPPPPVDPRTARRRAQITALQNWVTSIIAVYGNVRSLWQPGGPFHNIPRNIFDDINIRPPVGTDTGPNSQWA